MPYRKVRGPADPAGPAHTPNEGRDLWNLNDEELFGLMAQAQAVLARKADLVDGKVPPGQIPELAVTRPSVVGSEAAMLALAAQVGDVAVRTDVSRSFMLGGDDPAVLANWIPFTFAGTAGMSQADADARYVNETDHTKLAHDDLGIDAETLDGFDSAAFARSVNGAAPDANGNVSVSTGAAGAITPVRAYQRTPEGTTTIAASATELRSSANSSQVWRWGADLSGVTEMRLRAMFTGSGSGTPTIYADFLKADRSAFVTNAASDGTRIELVFNPSADFDKSLVSAWKPLSADAKAAAFWRTVGLGGGGVAWNLLHFAVEVR